VVVLFLEFQFGYLVVWLFGCLFNRMKGDAKITIFQHHKDDNLSANNFELDFMLLFHFFGTRL